jgi:hypothetical protein
VILEFRVTGPKGKQFHRKIGTAPGENLLEYSGHIKKKARPAP